MPLNCKASKNTNNVYCLDKYLKPCILGSIDRIYQLTKSNPAYALAVREEEPTSEKGYINSIKIL